MPRHGEAARTEPVDQRAHSGDLGGWRYVFFGRTCAFAQPGEPQNGQRGAFVVGHAARITWVGHAARITWVGHAARITWSAMPADYLGPPCRACHFGVGTVSTVPFGWMIVLVPFAVRHHDSTGRRPGW